MARTFARTTLIFSPFLSLSLIYSLDIYSRQRSRRFTPITRGKFSAATFHLCARSFAKARSVRRQIVNTILDFGISGHWTSYNDGLFTVRESLFDVSSSSWRGGKRRGSEGHERDGNRFEDVWCDGSDEWKQNGGPRSFASYHRARNTARSTGIRRPTVVYYTSIVSLASYI